MPRFLIAYDICSPKRLARVARRLERFATRVQKSVFLYEGEEARLRTLLMEELAPLIRRKVDRIEAWRLTHAQPRPRLLVGVAAAWKPAVAVIAGGAPSIVDSEWNPS